MQEGEQKMSVKTGGVGISPDIDDLLALDSKSIEHYAATVLASAIIGREIQTEDESSEPKYIMGNYIKDLEVGNIIERYKKSADEEYMQEKGAEVHKDASDKVLIRYGINPEDADAAEEFYKDYLKLEAEYLVEGAMLTCSQATDEVINIKMDPPENPVKGVMYVIGEYFFSGKESDIENPLQNIENPAHDSNDSRYATVSDSKKLHNIFPFKNCKLSNACESNETKIKAQKEKCMKYGTCYALMDLCEEWTNVLEGGKFRTSDKDMKTSINMLSQLGCFCGGFIYPIDSGQVEIEENEKEVFKYKWDKEGLPSTNFVTPEFKEKVIDIAEKLQINPDDLMAVMAYESWFDPTAKNIYGAYGLIQFTNTAINEINRVNGTSYTKNDIKGMSALEQMDLVYLHYKEKVGKMLDLGDVYLVTFAPDFVNGIYMDDDTILYSKENDPKFYNANKGLDRDNKGYITKGDAYVAVLERIEEFID